MIVTIWIHVAILPEPSVALKVRTIVPTVQLLRLSTCVSVTVAEQLSVAVAFPN